MKRKDIRTSPGVVERQNETEADEKDKSEEMEQRDKRMGWMDILPSYSSRWIWGQMAGEVGN